MTRHKLSHVGLAMAAIFTGWGLLGSPASADDAPRVIDFKGIHSQLNPKHWPILGSADAPVVLVELFDYTCGSCQQMSARVNAARQRYGDDLAVIVVPVVLDGRNQHRSQQLAKLSLSVFVADRTKFPEFHKWLLTGPAPNTARQRAAQLIGAATLRKAIASKAVSQYYRLSATLYNNANRGKLPVLASDKFATRGAMQHNQELFGVIDRFHRIEPVLNNKMAGR